MNKKLDKLKSTHVIQSQAKAHEKKVSQAEAQLKSFKSTNDF
jgi:hypothetical protein